jgi:hypothetical protein
MPANDRLQLARDIYGAYESGDRSVVEQLLSVISLALCTAQRHGPPAGVVPASAGPRL